MSPAARSGICVGNSARHRKEDAELRVSRAPAPAVGSSRCLPEAPLQPRPAAISRLAIFPHDDRVPRAPNSSSSDNSPTPRPRPGRRRRLAARTWCCHKVRPRRRWRRRPPPRRSTSAAVTKVAEVRTGRARGRRCSRRRRGSRSTPTASAAPRRQPHVGARPQRPAELEERKTAAAERALAAEDDSSPAGLRSGDAAAPSHGMQLPAFGSGRRPSVPSADLAARMAAEVERADCAVMVRDVTMATLPTRAANPSANSFALDAGPYAVDRVGRVGFDVGGGGGGRRPPPG